MLTGSKNTLSAFENFEFKLVVIDHVKSFKYLGVATDEKWSRKPHLLHVTQEFHSIKLICRNLYAIFSHVKKAYTANQNGVQLFSHLKYNQSTIA